MPTDLPVSFPDGTLTSRSSRPLKNRLPRPGRGGANRGPVSTVVFSLHSCNSFLPEKGKKATTGHDAWGPNTRRGITLDAVLVAAPLWACGVACLWPLAPWWCPLSGPASMPMKRPYPSTLLGSRRTAANPPPGVGCPLPGNRERPLGGAGKTSSGRTGAPLSRKEPASYGDLYERRTGPFRESVQPGLNRGPLPAFSRGRHTGAPDLKKRPPANGAIASPFLC
jgi:hypothetical protein